MLQIDRPLGLGELLDGAFRLYRANFTRLILVAAIFLVPVGVLSTLLLGATAGSFTSLLLAAGGEPINPSFDPGLSAVGAYLVSGLLGYLALGLVYVSLTTQVTGLLQGEQLGAGESIRRGVSRLPAFIGMAIVAGLAVAGLVLALYVALLVVFFVSAMLFGALSAFSESNGVAAIAILLAILVFLFYMVALVVVFIPVGMLLARWVAAPILVVAEKLGPVTSLSRSWELTRNHLWRTFGYLLLLFIFNAVVLGLPMAVLQWVLLFALTTQWYAWLSGLLVGLGYLVNVLWYPFIVLALTMYYFDLRVRNESLDLEVRVRRLEESTRPVSLPS